MGKIKNIIIALDDDDYHIDLTDGSQPPTLEELLKEVHDAHIEGILSVPVPDNE